MTAVLRQGETVTPLELFFDLVFVLALTQCTALMAAEPTWKGLATRRLSEAQEGRERNEMARDSFSYGEARTRIRNELRHEGELER